MSNPIRKITNPVIGVGKDAFSAVGGLFGGAKPGTPEQPVGLDPAAQTADLEAQANADRQAQADATLNGRRSTISAGLSDAATAQYGRGLLSQKKRAAASRDMGMA